MQLTLAHIRYGPNDSQSEKRTAETVYGLSMIVLQFHLGRQSVSIHIRALFARYTKCPSCDYWQLMQFCSTSCVSNY